MEQNLVRLPIATPALAPGGRVNRDRARFDPSGCLFRPGEFRATCMRTPRWTRRRCARRQPPKPCRII